MKLRTHHTILLAAALVVSACAVGPPAPSPSATAVPPPAPGPTAAATSAPRAVATPAAAASGVALPPASVLSFRSKGAFKLETTPSSGQPAEQRLGFDANWKRARNPEGFDLEVHMTGLQAMDSVSGAPGNMSVLMVGDKVYADFGDNKWLSNTRDQAPLDQLPYFFTNPEAIVPPLDGLRQVGTETVNGVEAIHYTFDDSIVFDRFFAAVDAAAKGSVSSTHGDIWVAAGDAYLLKMTFTATVDDKPIKDASGATVPGKETLDWSYERYDLNTDFEIAPPTAAKPPVTVQLPGFDPKRSLQLPPNSEPRALSGTMVVVVSQIPPAEAKAFFSQQFADLGWQEQGGNPPTWTKDNLRLTLVVNGPENGPARSALTVDAVGKK